MVIRILFLILLATEVSAQTNGVFRIYFTDKNNSNFSLSEPEVYLSQKSIDRRNKYSISFVQDDLPITPAYKNAVLSFSNVNLKAQSKWFNCLAIETDSLTLDSILNLPFVSNAVRLKSKEIHSPNQKLEIQRNRRFVAASENYYGAAFDQIEMHNGHLLHNQDFRGEGMTIAVLDAGFPMVDQMEPYSHLFLYNRILGTYNFVSDTEDVYTNSHIHGSLVLSTMAAILPYEMVGTAPNANYYLFVTEDADIEMPIEEDHWVEAAEFADSAGVDLINTSLGYTTFDDSTLNHTYDDLDGNTTMITRGADKAASKGILVVCSAGNNGTSSWYRIGAPGDADSVMTAAAVGKDRLYAEFSSKGPAADGDIKPNIAAQGYLAAMIWPGADVTLGSGTSFSSPIACGLTACLWQAHPDKNNMEIINAIQVSSSHFSAPDSLTGYGIPDFFLAHQLLTGDGTTQNDFFVENIFPNPFSSEIHLDVYAGNSETVDLKFYSVTGEIIYENTVLLKPAMKNRISLSRNFEKLSAGMYFVEIKTGNFNQVIKLQYLQP